MNMSTSFTIIVIDGMDSFECKAEASLLSGIEFQQKQAVKVGCRGGGCGVCKIRILSGDYTTKKMSVKHVTPDESEKGYALSCRVFPRSDMVIAAEPSADATNTLK